MARSKADVGTWVDADIACAVVADFIHVQPEAVNWRHTVQPLHRHSFNKALAEEV